MFTLIVLQERVTVFPLVLGHLCACVMYIIIWWYVATSDHMVVVRVPEMLFQIPCMQLVLNELIVCRVFL